MQFMVTIGEDEYSFDATRTIHGWRDGHWFLLERLVEDQTQALIVAIDDPLLRLFVEILGDYFSEQRTQRCLLSLLFLQAS
jgi:hypothetical protein